MIIMYERIDDKKEPFIETKRIQLGISYFLLSPFSPSYLLISFSPSLLIHSHPHTYTYPLLLPHHARFTFLTLDNIIITITAIHYRHIAVAFCAYPLLLLRHPLFTFVTLFVTIPITITGTSRLHFAAIFPSEERAAIVTKHNRLLMMQIDSTSTAR